MTTLKEIMQVVRTIEAMDANARQSLLDYFHSSTSSPRVPSPPHREKRVRRGKHNKYTAEQRREILQWGDNHAREQNGRRTRGIWTILARRFGKGYSGVMLCSMYTGMKKRAQSIALAHEKRK